MGVDTFNILNSEDNKENKEETKDNKKCDFKLNLRESLKLNKITKALKVEQKELRRGLCCSIVLVAIATIISFAMLIKYIDTLFEVIAVLIISTTASLLLAAFIGVDEFIGVDAYTTEKLRLLEDILNKDSKKSANDSVHDFLLDIDSYDELYKSELLKVLDTKNIIRTYRIKEYSKLLYCANSKHRVDRIKVKKDEYGYIIVKITLINKASNKENNFELNCDKIKISDDITSITIDLHNRKTIIIIPSSIVNGIKAKHIKKLYIDCKNETVNIKTDSKKKNKNATKEDKNSNNEGSSTLSSEESLTEIEKLIQKVEEQVKEDKEEHTTKIIIPYKD